MTESIQYFDIYVRIIDNYGDIGFVIGYIDDWNRTYGGAYFRIITDDVVTAEMFVNNNNLHSVVSCFSETDTLTIPYPKTIALLAFHYPIDSIILHRNYQLSYRLDYLSLDPEWCRNSFTEHILSHKHARIFEVVNSPLPDATGVLHVFPSEVSREELIRRYSLPPNIGEKKWIFYFCYADTLARFSYDVDEDVVVLVAGRANLDFPHVQLPFLPMEDFYRFIELSERVFVRGEVSFMGALSRNRCVFWDQYHEIGNYNIEQKEEFFRWASASLEYRDLHHKLNNPHIPLSLRGFVQLPSSSFPDFLGLLHQSNHFIHTLKKHIDRFTFSI